MELPDQLTKRIDAVKDQAEGLLGEMMGLLGRLETFGQGRDFIQH